MPTADSSRDAYGRVTGRVAIEERPIFVFASGERCGSTLLQRYLTSHPAVFIFGEQHGALNHLAEFYFTANSQAETYRDVTEAFISKGVDEFIANLCPSPQSITNATRSALMNLLGGFGTRWGCKEVRCGLGVVTMLSESFPGTKCVLLVRDITSCISSLIRWDASFEFCEEVVQRWNTLASEFLACHRLMERNVLLVRYEDLIRDTDGVSRTICVFLELPHEQMDGDVFNLRVPDHRHIERVSGAAPRELLTMSPEHNRLWQSNDVLLTRRALGYV